MPADPAAEKRLLADVRTLIDSARGQLAQAVNAGLVRLYWSVGRRIRQEILSERRAEYGEDARILQTLSAKLGWSHFVELISMTDPLKRNFYAEMRRLERWSVRVLRQKIRGMLYERTALPARYLNWATSGCPNPMAGVLIKQQSCCTLD